MVGEEKGLRLGYQKGGFGLWGGVQKIWFYVKFVIILGLESFFVGGGQDFVVIFFLQSEENQVQRGEGVCLKLYRVNYNFCGLVVFQIIFCFFKVFR